MTNKKSILIIMVLFIMTVTACSSGISQEAYDNLEGQFEAVKNELIQVKEDKLALNNLLDKANSSELAYVELKTKFESLVKDYEECEEKYKTLLQQNGTLQKQYENLQEQYETATSGFESITEAEVEEALFDIINHRRIENGLAPFLWGKNLYSWAKNNSKSMAQSKTMTYSDYYASQEVFWAIGYNSLEDITSAAITMWSLNDYTYKAHFQQNVTYGTVGAYKDGGVYYITYMADVFQ